MLLLLFLNITFIYWIQNRRVSNAISIREVVLMAYLALQWSRKARTSIHEARETVQLC